MGWGEERRKNDRRGVRRKEEVRVVEKGEKKRAEKKKGEGMER